MQKRFFDAHCDTGSECFDRLAEIKENSLHLDLERMKRYDAYIQVFAAFVDQKNISVSPFKHCLSVLDFLKKQLEKNKDTISLIVSKNDLQRVAESGNLGAILAIEGGEALGGSLENLYYFYKMGVRLITLTWNYANEIADGVLEHKNGGLSKFGKIAVSVMEELGILIDVSHLSEQGFWDVVDNTKHPFVASHSNAKALCDHPRNLSDDQILCTAKRNGCIGINFYPFFLKQNGAASIYDIFRHIEHIVCIAGEDCIGFGSDFDGVSCLPDGIEGVESVGDILAVLKNTGYSDAFLEKLCFGNFYRIFYETIGRRK